MKDESLLLLDCPMRLDLAREYHLVLVRFALIETYSLSPSKNF